MSKKFVKVRKIRVEEMGCVVLCECGAMAESGTGKCEECGYTEARQSHSMTMVVTEPQDYTYRDGPWERESS